MDDPASLGNQPDSRIAVYGIVRNEGRRMCGRLSIGWNEREILYNRDIHYTICRTACNYRFFIHQVSYDPTHLM